MLAYKSLAYTDPMTGLLNRTAYMEEERLPLSQGCIYILLDINNLKQINDQYGHRQGDQLIIRAARHIQRCFREEGSCYRIGGDEFLVILKKSSEAQVVSDLSAMKKQILEENEMSGETLTIAAGYAVQQEDDTAETLFQRADHCMYRNKEEMKNICLR